MTVVKLRDNNQPLTFLISRNPFGISRCLGSFGVGLARFLFPLPLCLFHHLLFHLAPTSPSHRFDINALVIAEGWHPPRWQLLLIRDPPISIFGGWRRRPGTSGSLGLGRGVKI